ncbi:MAG: hypothetical protein CVV42_06560 [Candidatus Riflebacteria bacterium HGW-Riflebacteria-2]|nr:MAG: hypothetical protein CVV42_06560 [Candidatus Riflebacteria bacterium HGW-Riflebacteria-2]
MTIKKANAGSNKTLIRRVFILLLLLFATGTGQAAITNQTAVLSSDLNGDGIAGIGDTITFTCRSNTADPSQYPYVNLSSFGNPYFPLVNIAGDFYSAFLTVSPGSVENNTVQTFQFADEGGVRIGGSLLVDNRRPNSLYGPSTTGATGLSSVYKVGDNLQIDMEMSTSFDSDVPRANLTNIGLGASHIMSRVGGPDSSPVYRLSLTFPLNREGTATPISVAATDDAGNSRSWDLSVSYDTVEPEIQSVTAVNMTTGKSWVTSGDTIRIQAVIGNYDFDKVVMYNATLFPTGITMIRVSGNTPGSEAVYQYDYYLADVPDLQSNFVTFEVRATDDAGNPSNPRTSNPLALDNIPPEFSLPMGVAMIENGGIIGDNIAIINDQLHFYGNMSSVMNDVIITVDLSAIGGVANQIVPFNNSATTTFELLYNVIQYTSENTMPRAFTLTAKDTAGNQISQVILPIVYVDNTPPTLSGAQIQNVSRPNQIIRHGDQLAISASVANIDNGSVWVNFERIGGTASSTLAPYSGTTYRLDHVVGDPTTGFPYDQNVAFTIYAVDDSGNMVQTVSSPVMVDNEPPLVIGSSYISDPVLTPSHPFVRVNDRVTFRVQLASSSASVHDSESVKLNLSEFGEAAAVDMVYDGIASYSYTTDVPAGTLNNEYYFTFAATDNAGNSRPGTIKVKIDNRPCDVGPMAVNWLTDLNKSGVVNIGDRLELIVPVDEPDAGTCTIDLSLVGGASSYVMSYDAILRRYYLIHDCLESATENPSYIFRASVTDKAGNIMNSLSSPFEVDCRPPFIEYASATFQDLKGKQGVVNIGDKVSILAKVDLGRLDGGAPTVNLTAIGGSSAQQLLDDGANNDGIAGDGLYGYTHTVVTGTTDGASTTFTVQITDNAGNRGLASTEQLFVDNQPLVVNSITVTQVVDTNDNGVVDLDGYYTTEHFVATDVVKLELNIQGSSNDMGTITVDLSKFGYTDTASMVTPLVAPGGWQVQKEYMPKAGTTNGETVYLTVKLTDVNGNEVVSNTTNSVVVDNRPPTIEIYPITFVVDNGRQGEANLGDVIQIKVRLNYHDGILPQIDFENLFNENGLTAPSPTLFPPNPSGGNEYTYQWTVPEGLGTRSSLVILAFDINKNMSVAYTIPIRFLSKTPVFAGFPQSRTDLFVDRNFNNILNPVTYIASGDSVKITAVLSSLYNEANDPVAEVLADIRTITNSTSDDSTARYYDGDIRTYWTPLSYVPASGAPYIYSATFVASASDYGLDANTVSFPVKVLHPDTPALTMANSVIECDPANPFGIDTLLPRIKAGSAKMIVVENNGDNLIANTANIGDIIRVEAEIERFTDPGSATVVLYTSLGSQEVFRAPLTQVTGTNVWQATFEVATGTTAVPIEVGEGEWLIVNGDILRYEIFVSDDADNQTTSGKLVPSPALTFDNQPPLININTIVQRVEVVNPQNTENWVANVGNGVASDSISAWVELTEALPNGQAYVDLSPIGATTTYQLKPNAVNATRFSTDGGITFPNKYAHYRLENGNYDLATHTFRIYVVDRYGNKAYVDDEYTQLAVDSKRPELSYATYDGMNLSLVFSEPVNPATFDIEQIRIGYRNAHTNIEVGNKTAFALSLANNDLLITESITDTMQITLASPSRTIIADWGRRTLYISLSTNDTQTGFDPIFHVVKDESGNWLKPISRNITLQQLLIPNDFYTRPKLIGGRYVANLSDEISKQLYIEFDKDMDATTMDDTTLKNLAIWGNRASNNETWVNRYRFNTLASDTFDPYSTLNTLRSLKVELSQEAQDWIALKYGRLGTQFHLQITGTEFEPPPYNGLTPLIRDTEGNSVMPITPTNAVVASLTPLSTPFQVAAGSLLDLSGGIPMLTINIQNRRARLFNDAHNESTLSLTKTQPADLSRVYIYEKADTANSRSISLGSLSQANPMVRWTGANSYTELNDYASTTIRIPLSDEALKSILSWGTSDFFLACSNSAFRDLWGNLSEAFPGTSGQASLLQKNLPTGYAPARIHTVAISPVTTASSTKLFKGYPADNFFYEVAFETATLSADVSIPIARNIVPILELYRSSDNVRIDTGKFVSWLDHNQGGVTRTVARYTNTTLPEAGDLQKIDVYVQVSNFTDIFNVGAPAFGQASEAFDLSKKTTSGVSQYGFDDTRAQMVFDNKMPRAIDVIQPNTTLGSYTIGIMPAGSYFKVIFDEDMNRGDSGTLEPQMRLGLDGTAVMSFVFRNWQDGRTALFTNSANFDANTLQGGPYYYFVSGGFDEAGNRGANDPDSRIASIPVTIRSKGPIISGYEVTTYQQTTAKDNTVLVNQPFSPYVEPYVATITVTFQQAPVATDLWLRIQPTNGTEIASIPLTLAPDRLSGTAAWDGKSTATGLFYGVLGPISFELRVYDDANNEGSTRGTITYDGKEPKVSSWQFANVKTVNNVAYFSPIVSSFVKVDVSGPAGGDTVKMRLTSGVATETYQMGQTTTGYTISFDGKHTNTPPGRLEDGNYMVSLVDLAGNVGTGSGANSKATATLIIDTVSPPISAIRLYRHDTGTEVSSFSPWGATNKLRIVATTTDPSDIASGTAMAKITVGSTLIKEILLEGGPGATDLTALWDGKDTSQQLVQDGVYQVTVTDLAGNPSGITVDIKVTTSRFRVTGVTQVNDRTALLTFSHDVFTGIASGTPFTISSAENLPVGISVGAMTVDNIDGNKVTLPFTMPFADGIAYTITVSVGYPSLDGVPLETGYNIATFTADTKGPEITTITYDGLTSQKQFNVVFSEQIEETTARTVSNYKLTTGTASTELTILSVTVRADKSSVTISCRDDIVEDTEYTITATGVQDNFGNLSNSSLPFFGRDIKPPELLISAFSSPANEFDISVVVKSNEALSGAPTATITQSGASAISLILNPGPNSMIFIGGAHLDSNYPGVATIKVSARDTSSNLGTSNMSFSTAYVNASVRASVKSVDENFEVVFEPGTLKSNSVVTVLHEELARVGEDTTLPSIVPSIMADLSAEQRSTLRGSSLSGSSSGNSIELTPVGSAYSLNVPAGRIIKPVRMSLKLEESQIGNGIGMYRSEAAGWKPVAFAVSDGVASFEETTGGTFAMMKDVLAPRANMTTEIGDEPIREARPTFSWQLEELASGLDRDSAWAMLDGKLQPLMIDKAGITANFVPVENLIGGEHEISLRIADKAGNMTVTPALRFVAQPPLDIYDVVQYPNPARNRASMRISTNRNDIDWNEVEVNIYDVAGHKVADQRNLSLRGSSKQGNTHVQEVLWDLRATGGKAVANGVYFARITVRDPDDWGKKTKYTHKIAVLR